MGVQVFDSLDVSQFDDEVFNAIFRENFERTSLQQVMAVSLGEPQRASIYDSRLEVFNVRAGSTIVEAGIFLQVRVGVCVCVAKPQHDGPRETWHPRVPCLRARGTRTNAPFSLEHVSSSTHCIQGSVLRQGSALH
jgi:hypothetical protein